MRVMISAHNEPERLVQGNPDLDIVTDSTGTTLEQWKVVHCFPQNALEKQVARKWPPPKDASWLPYWFSDCVSGLTKERLALFQWLKKKAPEPVADTEALLEALEDYDVIPEDDPIPEDSTAVDEIRVGGKLFLVLSSRRSDTGPSGTVTFWAIGGIVAGALLLDLYSRRRGSSPPQGLANR